MDDEIDYHRRRALRELDLGIGAESSEAARAHLELSSLHLKRMEALKAEFEPAPDRARSAFSF
jgi:hypothetical protein